MWNWLIIPVIFTVLVLAGLSLLSRYRRVDTGLVNGRLRNCPASPNCISSEDSTNPSFIEPVHFAAQPDEAWKIAELTLQEMGGTIISKNTKYLHATFTSPIIRFVDDMELRLDAAKKIVHFRSSSRVGYSDMGMNKKRVAEFRRRMNLKL